MRGMNSASVDLIYLDPPFNSNADYSAPIGSQAAGAAFKDTWGLDDINLAWHGEIKHEQPGLYDLLNATRRIHGDSMMSYLIYMAIRVMEMRRLIAPTGSLYLHCDPTASHYLKLMLDDVFGGPNFRNEIIWKRTTGRSDAQRFGRVHDVILYYSSGAGTTWNKQYQPYDAEYISAKYRHDDSDGRGPYRTGDLTGPGVNPNDAPLGEWHPANIGRCWSVPRTGAYAEWIDTNLIPGYRSIDDAEARLAALEAADMIYWSKKGTPELRRYLAGGLGTAAGDVITDTPPVNSQAAERVGYPTQKPLALLRRIIDASSNPDDVVLDPFCGCATACIAAEQLGRQWVGIDISPKAAELVAMRMHKEIGLFYDGDHREDIPKRTDLGKLPKYNCVANKKWLYGEQGGYCNGCSTHFKAQNLTVDHIIPRAKGGTDHISNLQLLCGHCNSVKGDRPMDYLIACLTDKGWIKRQFDYTELGEAAT